jgi:hydroxymethylbilane synthase
VPHLRLATRGSAQATTQARAVADALVARHPGLDVELVFVETMGDVRTDVPLHQLGGQGIFVKEVQRAVLAGQADLAVHSAKDLPSQPADGLALAAFTERRDPRDALVGRPLDDLELGATVATGSVRRRAQLAQLRPDLTFVELRGNIPTRLGKVPEGGAIVMAVAALQILGLTDRVAQVMTVEEMVPMIGQGCVAVECRSGDIAAMELLAAIDHEPTRRAVSTERAFLAELGGGCTMPVGAHVAEGVLRTFLADPETGRVVREQVELDDTGAVEDDLAAAVAAARRAKETLGA